MTKKDVYEYAGLAEKVLRTIDKLGRNPAKTNDIEEQWAKWIVLMEGPCRTCKFFEARTIHQGVGLLCQARISPGSLAGSLLANIDFSAYTPGEVGAVVRERLQIMDEKGQKIDCWSYERG